MPQNLFAACPTDDGLIAKRVRLDNNVQKAVEATFADQEARFREGIVEEVDFDGKWTPDEDQVLTIDVPQDGQMFIDTINANPVAIPDIDTAHFDEQNIKAIFTGINANGAAKILVQQFSARQMLSRKFSLLQDGNAFRRLTDPAFTLDTSLTCIVEDGKIKFKSFHKMRAILNLVEVYRTATDQEVHDFAGHASFETADIDAFMQTTDQISRKLIHAIQSSGVLDNYTVDDIEEAASNVGLEVATNNGRLVMPPSRAEIKRLLRFLDDGLYEAPLSGNRYVTNSKRLA